jgi:lia operon protein LiaF
MNDFGHRRHSGRLILGFILIILGIIYLLANIYPEFDAGRFIGKLWPLILIAIGLYLVLSRSYFWPRAYIGRNASGHSRIVGDLRLDFVNKEIGDVAASEIVGDLTVDLKGGRLKPGINNLNISMVVGDSLLLIPTAFPLRISARTILGDIKFDGRNEEGFLPRLDHTDDSYQSAEKKLFITLSGIIGDMTVQRV